MKGLTVPFYFYSGYGVKESSKGIIETRCVWKKVVYFIKPADITESQKI